MSAVMPERLPLAPEFREDPIVPLVESMIAHVGENVHRAGLRRTPQRFAEALRFLTSGYQADPEQVIGRGVFAAEGEGTVLVRDIEFFSLCEHHLLPFFGRAHVAYLPGTHIIGLSKIPRLVDLYARRFQVQERLTGQIADALERILEPRGVLVRVEARHLCMAMRGVQKQHSATETLALRGVYADDPHARQETLAMLRPAAAAPW